MELFTQSTSKRLLSCLLIIMLSAQSVLISSCKKEDDVIPSASASSSGSESAPASGSADNGVEIAPDEQSTDDNSTSTPSSGDQTAVPATAPVTGQTAYTIKSSEQIVDAEKLNLAPGAVVKLEAGARGPLLLKNFKGSAGAPITFVNGSGVTTIQSSGSYGIKTENCTNFRITGSGSGTKGIVIDGGNIGLTLDYLSNQFEVDNLEVKNCGFAGIMAKTDPGCDTKTHRGNFLMENLKFHDNYVHDVKGEGFYIGNSFHEEGRALDCGNILPHEITNVEVYNNTIKKSGCEGIQAGCVTSGLKIYNNRIDEFGISPFADAQNNGIQVGEGSSGLVYNNIVQNGPGVGIIVLGKGNTTVSNNLVVNPGSYGAFIDNRGSCSGEITFANNTFINPGDGGIKTYNELVKNKFCNNIIAGTSKFFIYGSSATGEESNNLTKDYIEECGFVDPSAGNYKLKKESPAVDAGMNIGGVNSDMENKSRPSGAAHDIGAFEL